ncbi:MAG TPA: ABC transporter substrate-binding protein [Pseudorhodoferax sp.]|nr:ABC transporter substrate-binding protein [Pseudorhodoferax sp.]
MRHAGRTQGFFAHSRRCWLAAACLAAFAAGPVAAQAPASGEPIRIGSLLSVTGGLASVGLPEREGMLVAQKVLNARGGIQGRPLVIVQEDDASSPDSAVSKINALVFTHKVRAIIGTSGIAQTVAVGGITQNAKVPLLAFTGLGPAVERQRNCVFHLTPAQELNARGLLAYARDHRLGRIGVLHDSGYGQVIWNSMKGLTQEYGVEVVALEKFDIAATDVTTQAAKLKAAKPDGVIVMSTASVPFRALRQVKLEAPMISVHGSSTYETVKAMGDAADNVIFPEFLIAEDPLPTQQEFVEAYRKEYGKLPKHFSAAAWDAVMALADALQTAGADASGEKLCAAMRRPYVGAMARFDFSAPDMGGLDLSSFNYAKLTGGRYSRLAYKPAQ